MFQLGFSFETTCIFTGGHHTYTVISRDKHTLFCEYSYYEIDGIHTGEKMFEILKDDNGKEYIVIWEYKGERGCVYPEN